MAEPLQILADRIRDAAAAGRPLRIRGGGTKDFLAEALQGEILSTREEPALAGVVSYEPSELVVTVRSGASLAELEALLAQQGQCLPFEPPHFGAGATVGGMVASGLSGPARASAGPVKDYVLGATLLNGRGEHLVFGGQVMKNVAGYDVSRLMAGAFGTLGLLVELSLKVLPVAPAQATLRFEMDQAEALRRLNAWGGQPLPLNASCWVEEGGRGVLYLRLRGAVAAVEAACRGLGGERMDNAQAGPDWALCREQRLPWFEDLGDRELWRVSVPQVTPALDLPGGPPLIEWHGGQRWLKAEPGQGARVRAAAGAAGGHATLFRPAPGSDASQPRFTAPAPALLRIQRELQRQFDPAGIFNPGRLFRDEA